jgi:hypothetical protein
MMRRICWSIKRTSEPELKYLGNTKPTERAEDTKSTGRQAGITRHVYLVRLVVGANLLFPSIESPARTTLVDTCTVPYLTLFRKGFSKKSDESDNIAIKNVKYMTQSRHHKTTLKSSLMKSVGQH